MNNADYIRYRIAVEELGWRRTDGCWQRPDQPSFGDLSQVLHYEWQQALARAGRADHCLEECVRTLNIVSIGTAGIILLLVAIILFSRPVG